MSAKLTDRLERIPPADRQRWIDNLPLGERWQLLSDQLLQHIVFMMAMIEARRNPRILEKAKWN